MDAVHVQVASRLAAGISVAHRDLPGRPGEERTETMEIDDLVRIQDGFKEIADCDAGSLRADYYQDLDGAKWSLLGVDPQCRDLLTRFSALAYQAAGDKGARCQGTQALGGQTL